MEIFIVHRLEDQDGTIHSSIVKACTTKELANKELLKEVEKVEKSFNENKESYGKNDFLGGYELWSDSADIFITVDEIDLEGSLFVVNELNQLEEDTYNECKNVFTTNDEALIEANKCLDEVQEQLKDFERNDWSVSTDNTIVTESIDEIKL